MTQKCTGYLVRKAGYYHIVLAERFGKGRKLRWIRTGIRIGEPRYLAERVLREKLRRLHEDAKRAGQITQWGGDAGLLSAPPSCYFAQWLETRKYAICERSLRLYERILRKAGQYLDETAAELRELNANHIQSYLELLAYEHKALSTIRLHGVVLRAVLEDACARGYLAHNPAKRVPVPQESARQWSGWDEDTQRKLLYGLKGHPLELPVHLAMVYGLRCGEICGLRWEDINWDDSLLYIRRNAVLTYDTDGSSRVIQTETMKTQASRRTFPLHPQTRTLMRVREEQAGEGNGAIFIAKNGRPMRPDGLSRRFCHFLQQNGLPKIRFHDLRHLCATALADRGCELTEVQAYLGHASIQTTLRYAHLNPDNNGNVFQIMQNALTAVG